ncbi:MAG TPA: hypothetical protein VK654_12795 [Nitrospirota bacterium]|nr:hypothetical protein [Nitrospirota bacterium]
MPIMLILFQAKERPMDILFIGMIAVLFVTSWFFVKLVERL